MAQISGTATQPASYRQNFRAWICARCTEVNRKNDVTNGDELWCHGCGDRHVAKLVDCGPEAQTEEKT